MAVVFCFFFLNLGVGHHMEFFSNLLGRRRRGFLYVSQTVTLDVQRTNENQIPHSRVFCLLFILTSRMRSNS